MQFTSFDVPKPKPQNEFKMTAQPTEVILQHLKLAALFASLHTLKGLWQFPVDVEYQKIYCLLTEVGILTSERIVQGSTQEERAVCGAHHLVKEEDIQGWSTVRVCLPPGTCRASSSRNG